MVAGGQRTIPAKNAELGDPVPGVGKTLLVLVETGPAVDVSGSLPGLTGP